MRKLFYMGIEPIESRYTLQLTDWSERVFQRRNLDYVIVPGQTIDNSKAIQVGQVLDAHGRSFFSMSQMMNLVQMMRNGDVSGDDAIFFEDMFTPGIESLAYIMNQIPISKRPNIYVRCLAQSIDPDDFVNVHGMSEWMGHFEKMVNAMPNMYILATDEEMVAHMRIAGWKAPIYNISGLAFSKEEVRSRVSNIPDFMSRPLRIVFAARWDQEKQPGFFMDLVERIKSKDENIEFCVVQGKKLSSNNSNYVTRALMLRDKGILSIYENLTKNEYYEILANSRVLINTALQDWVSNTVSEADTLGTNVLYPAYRSFPETFANDYERLYVPWSLDDAEQKLKLLLKAPHKNIGKISNWTDGTIDRCIDIMHGFGTQWLRSGNRYRDFVAENKY